MRFSVLVHSQVSSRFDDSSEPREQSPVASDDVKAEFNPSLVNGTKIRASVLAGWDTTSVASVAVGVES